MKKLTLLLAATIMIAGSVSAQDKACCKKNGGKCAKAEACSKDKKNCTKECAKQAQVQKTTMTKKAS
jgi:hypothetical protein